MRDLHGSSYVCADACRKASANRVGANGVTKCSADVTSVLLPPLLPGMYKLPPLPVAGNYVYSVYIVCCKLYIPAESFCKMSSKCAYNNLKICNVIV